MATRSKEIVFSMGNAAAAAFVYWYLITGGWLTNHYQLDDPNIVNLALAIFEPLAVVGVIAFWIWRTRTLYRLLAASLLLQLLIALGFVAFFLIFALLWHPKMM